MKYIKSFQNIHIIKESSELINKDYIMIGDVDNIYIGKKLKNDNKRSIQMHYFYRFIKAELKLIEHSSFIEIKNSKLNIIYQSNDIKNCLIKLCNMYDDEYEKLNLPTYNNYIIGKSNKGIGIYEVIIKNNWDKYISRRPQVIERSIYYYDSKRYRIFDNNKENVKPKSLYYFNVDLKTIKQFKFYDDAHKELELELELTRDINKYNI